jgi:hypothetical protein
VANFTARLGLRKPLTSEIYDVTEFNTNNQTIDDKVMLMTDVNAAPAGTGANALLKLQVTGAGPASNRMLEGRRVGDANYGFAMDFDGGMQFGAGGATGPDVNLKRSAANTLYTDDGFRTNHACMTTLEVSDATARTFTATTYSSVVSAANVLSVGFTVPPSGKIMITVAARMYPSVGGNICFTTAELSGMSAGTIGTGAANDINATRNSVVGDDQKCNRYLVSGLTAFATGTITMVHKMNAGTGNVSHRKLTVEPCLN